jgi:hypothetical protein
MNDTERLDWLADQFGCALVNDDNGHWAVASAGMQNVPESDGPFDFLATFAIEKRFWRSSVREAIDAAIEDEENIASAPEEEEEDEETHL